MKLKTEDRLSLLLDVKEELNAKWSEEGIKASNNWDYNLYGICHIVTIIIGRRLNISMSQEKEISDNPLRKEFLRYLRKEREKELGGKLPGSYWFWGGDCPNFFKHKNGSYKLKIMWWYDARIQFIDRLIKEETQILALERELNTKQNPVVKKVKRWFSKIFNI